MQATFDQVHAELKASTEETVRLRAERSELEERYLADRAVLVTRVETAEGRREYQLGQAAVARRAAPLRRQLLHH